jgi:hypothetical protein
VKLKSFEIIGLELWYIDPGGKKEGRNVLQFLILGVNKLIGIL